MNEARRFAVGSWALVISADATLHEQARRGLKTLGMHCESATTVAAAFGSLEGGRREYAVVFLDLELPGVPAQDIDAIAAVTSPGAVVVRCGVRAAGTGAGAAGHPWIDKPCVGSDFVRAVTKLQGGATQR